MTWGEGEARPVSRRARWLAFAIVGVAVLIPVLRVEYPPILDLGQQMAQIPLFAQALGAKADVYRVSWSGPNKLSYLLLGAGWLVGGAQAGPRIALALLMLATLGSIHFLGALFRRPLASTVLSSVFVFSSTLYGGFFGFLLGGWGLALWLHELAAEPTARSRGGALARAAAIGALLYWTHALWLLAALGLLVLVALCRRPTRSLAPVRALGLLPLVLAFAVWNWTYAPVGDGKIFYDDPVLVRLIEPAKWVVYLLGGVKGWLEGATLALLACWALAVLLSARRARVGASAERTLMGAGLALLAATLLLPDLVADTWLFAHRWGPWAAVCLLLALPAVRWMGTRTATAVSLAFVALFCLATMQIWIGFDRETMRGFETCRRAIGEGESVLFLDFSRTDPRVWVYPTFQMAAYFQLDHDVELNFSFAEHRSSLVEYREHPRPITWTRKLEHYPRSVRPEDFAQFDFVLLHLPSWAVGRMETFYPSIEPVTGEAGWWLYRARTGAPNHE